MSLTERPALVLTGSRALALTEKLGSGADRETEAQALTGRQSPADRKAGNTATRFHASIIRSGPGTGVPTFP
jgi:hypothetical protein